MRAHDPIFESIFESLSLPLSLSPPLPPHPPPFPVCVCVFRVLPVMNNRERSQLTEYISAKRNRTVSEVLRVKAMTEVILLCAYIHNLHFGENFVAAMRNAVAHHTLVLSAHSFGFHLNLVFSCAKKKVPNFVSAHHTLILFQRTLLASA